MSQNLRPTSLIVAEIFNDLGIAFTRLGQIEMMLKSEDSSYKPSEGEMLALRQAVTKFGEGIDRICQRIKDRTLLQIRSSMKRHAYEEAGIPLRKQQIIATPKPAMSQEKVRNASSLMSQSSAKSADITLNMLNATEQEVDVEGLSAADKLELNSTDN